MRYSQLRISLRVTAASTALVTVLLPSQVARATPVSVCDEIETVVTHPAEYVEEKVRREGVRCLFQPHCCTPAWILSPDCYVTLRVLKRDVWTEVKKTFSCSSLDPKEAFNHWLRNVVRPVPGFSISPTAPVADVLGVYVSTAYTAASPLPPDIKAELRRYAVFGRAFSDRDLADARYLPASHRLAKPIWPGSEGGRWGITYYNLIIMEDSVLSQPHCTRVSKFAHELTHVAQYRAMGWEQFLTSYVQTLSSNNVYESAAYVTQTQVNNACVAAASSGGPGPVPACRSGDVRCKPGTLGMRQRCVSGRWQDSAACPGRASRCDSGACVDSTCPAGEIRCGNGQCGRYCCNSGRPCDSPCRGNICP